MKKENLEKAIKLRHELHEHPELSNQEVWTRNHLMEFLRENTGLEIVDRGRWFYAVYKSEKGRRNIGFRADFDALAMQEPDTLEYASKNAGVSHKCGHDGHCASLAAFAMEIDQEGSDNNIYFLFQHAEETGEGAREACVFIEENNIDEIFAFHNMSSMAHRSINIKDGTVNCASSGMTIKMEGQPSHASEPEKGKNPAFAIAKIIDAIPGLISLEKNEGMVLCTVIQVDVGERAFGVSPGRGELLLTIRALYQVEMDRLRENLESIARSEAEKFGLSVSFEYNDVFPETFNHKGSADKIRRVSLEKGMKLVEMPEAFRGSEDFGEYLKHTKGAICYIGNGEDYAPVHTYNFDFRDDIIETAVELFKGLSAL